VEGIDTSKVDGINRTKNKGKMSLRTAKKLRESQIKAILQLELDSNAASTLLSTIEDAAKSQHDHKSAVQLWASARRVADYWAGIENEMVNISHQLEPLSNAIAAADESDVDACIPTALKCHDQTQEDGSEVSVADDTDTACGGVCNRSGDCDERGVGTNYRKGIRWGDTPHI
jgi:hypothetical protein